MKKNINAGIGLGLALVSAGAFAQSSVTLYGSVDAGLQYVNNARGSSLLSLNSGRLGGNRWGLKGVEDLGGGMQAVFQLENGYNGMNGALGQAGRMFGRQAWVGLTGPQMGTISFGRQYDSMLGLVAPFYGSGVFVPATHIGDSDNMDQSFRLNNSVKYVSRNYAGFSFSGIYAFSNQASGSNGQGFSNNSAWGASVNYKNGPFTIGGGFEQLNHPNSTTNTSGAQGGASTTNGDDYSGVFFYGIDGGVARQQIAAGGTSYVYGPATIAFGYSHVTLNYNDGAARKLHNFDLYTQYRVTPALFLHGDYTYTDGSATGLPGASSSDLHPKWHQVTLGADYFLSKRTDLYAAAVYQHAAGDGSTLVNGRYAAIASIPIAGANSATANQVLLTAGMRHKF